MQHEIEKPPPCNELGGSEAWQANSASTSRKDATKPNTNHKNGHAITALRYRSPTFAHYEANPNPPTTQCHAKLQLILATITKKYN